MPRFQNRGKGSQWEEGGRNGRKTKYNKYEQKKRYCGIEKWKSEGSERDTERDEWGFWEAGQCTAAVHMFWFGGVCYMNNRSTFGLYFTISSFYNWFDYLIVLLNKLI